MDASPTFPAVDDDAEFATEVHEYLRIIANMQHDAEQRRCEIEALRLRAAAARCEGEKWQDERNAAAARLADMTANALLLQLQHQTLSRQQQEAESALLLMRKQKREWDAILLSCTTPLDKCRSCHSSSDNINEDTGCSVDNASVKIPQHVVWALRLWRQLPQSEGLLQELNVAVAELFAELQEDITSTASSSTECLLLLLPKLDNTEMAFLSLITFPFFPENKYIQTKVHFIESSNT